MLRLHCLLLMPLALGLAVSPLPAQQPVQGLSPADTRPSLTTPPSAPRVGPSAADPSAAGYSLNNPPASGYQPLESYPAANPSQSVGSSVVSGPSPGSCDCQVVPTIRYQPTQTLSPVVVPPAAYSSTYVPPPPASAAYAARVVYQRPVVYRQAVASPIVYQPLTAPAVAPAGASYYLPPILPVQNVPAGATIGRGVLGQPTVYVPGQPVRNFLRYLAP
jgi:hypothetical protein